MNNYYKDIEHLIKPKKTGIDYVKEMLNELERAESKHPEFPTDIIHMLAIMSEEAGEAVRAGLIYAYEGGEIEDVELELLQTAAMCLRVLKNLKRKDPPLVSL